MLIFPNHSKIVFVGDSITDAGRDRSAEPGGWGFGQGYVNHVHNLLTAVYPDKNLMTINSGVGGDDITQMEQRWQSDVLDFEPDFVSVMIGVNDAWRHFDGTLWQAPTHNEEEFELIYDRLLKLTRSKLPKLQGLIVVSPFMFETNHHESMRAMVESFSQAAQRVANKNQALFIDIQADIDHFLTRQHPCIASADHVHPNERGAMIVARSWLRATGFDWERDNFDN
ncbi:MAG: SGNH/GDSL hydrolase family protein [Bifidobacterium sp.]|jgi:lysophospholipase L1-like esterase|nr:SGNH/GDSL hydrolase family protein [Bifidobacterium sp.]MCH4174319.1 SGNH/GDSL hydrolase family protein [Bifidobacterium sp.]